MKQIITNFIFIICPLFFILPSICTTTCSIERSILIETSYASLLPYLNEMHIKISPYSTNSFITNISNTFKSVNVLSEQIDSYDKLLDVFI